MPQPDETDARIAHLIARAKERAKSFEDANRSQRRPRGRATQQDRAGPLGLRPSELEFLRRRVWTQFFEDVHVSPTTFNRWWPRLRETTQLDETTAECLTVDLARDYSKAIEKATRQFIDYLLQALLARRRRALSSKLRDTMLSVGLRFAGDLADWDAFCCWFAKNDELGLRIQLESKPTEPVLKRRRGFYQQRIVLYWQDWLSAIDQCIHLRTIISSSHRPREAAEGNQLKILIRHTREVNPNWSFRRLVGYVDGLFEKANKPIPMPSSWRQAGHTTLLQCFDSPQTRNRVKKYLSQVTSVT